MATNFWGAGFAKFLLEKLQFKSGAQIEGIGSDGVSLPIVKGSSEFGLITPNRYEISKFTGDTAQMSLETTNNLSGDSSFKFAPTVVNQEIITPLISLPKRALDKIDKSPMLAQLQYAANDPGFKIEVLDDANNVLISEKSIDETKSTLQLFPNLLSASTGIKLKIICDIYTASMEIVFDDVVFDDEPFKKIDTVEQEEYFVHTLAGSYGSVNQRIPYYTTEVTNTTGSIVTVDNSSTLGLSITANRDCRVYVQAPSSWAGTGERFGFTLNSSELSTNIYSITNTDDLVYVTPNQTTSTAVATIDLAAGDILRPHAGNLYSTVTNTPKWNLRLHAVATNESVVVENADEYTTGRDFTPEWTASTTNPSIGNGTLNGKYWREGKWLRGFITMRAGSTTTFGSGIWSVSVPDNLNIDTAALPSGTSHPHHVGLLSFEKTNGGLNKYQGLVTYDTTVSTNKFFLMTMGDDGGNDHLSSTAPLNAWVNTDSFYAEFRVPIAEWSATEAHIIPIADPYENVFSARIANNGTASITSESSSFIDSVTRSGSGRVDITFKAGFFSVAPAVTAAPYDATAGFSNISIIVSAVSTTGVTIVTERPDTMVNIDEDFNVSVQRQGADYKEPQGYFLSEVATNRFETKIQSSQQAGFGVTLSDLTFNNLEIGKSYRISGLMAHQAPSGDGEIRVHFVNGGVIVGASNLDPSASTNYRQIRVGVNTVFKATGTTLTFELFTGGSNSLMGNGTRQLTFITLEELNTHREVSGVF